MVRVKWHEGSDEFRGIVVSWLCDSDGNTFAVVKRGAYFTEVAIDNLEFDGWTD